MPRAVPPDEIEAIFAEGGPLATLLPGYQPRRAQIDMALAVAAALGTTRGRLVVEAGTGTGKSLAYLIPALLSDGRVVVATGTRALQDQLVDKDAPVAVEAVRRLRAGRPRNDGDDDDDDDDDEPRGKTVLRMKGRNNYLCLLRFERLDRQRTLGFDDTLVQIGRFASSTKTGDRAELTGLPDHLPLWSEIDADRDHCLGSACPSYEPCFLVALRRAAEQADVLVVNHHLLCADQRLRLDNASDAEGFARVLPDFDALIVDEAHTLPDVATDHFGLSCGTDALVRLGVDVRRAANACDGDSRAKLMNDADDLEATSKTAFDAVAAAGSGGTTVGVAAGGDTADALADARADRRLLRLTKDVEQATEALVDALAVLAHDLQKSRSKLVGKDGDVALQKATLDGLSGRTERARAELAFLCGSAASDDRFVCFVDKGPRGVTLTAAPIDVSSPLSGTIFAGDAPVVLTSATLAIGDDVGPFLRQVGLAPDEDPDGDAGAAGGSDRGAERGDDRGDDHDPTGARGHDDVARAIFPSPFDHARRAALYCPTDMPEPDAADWTRRFDDELLFLLSTSKGGALCLFTSHRAMDDAVSRLRAELDARGLRTRKQGERPKHALLDELRGDLRTVLFATASFWEGVDVRGAALRLVVIDRLPFRVPSDPLVRARAEHARKQGKDPFADIAVPEAALVLKQGAGRLLRTVDDAGVVAVLDGRLRKKRYGRVFLDALPPMTRVGSRATLAQFWTRFVQPALGLS
ncbi:MAG: ATP-dependent DNA helicase [Deltaproteobacteria bacterium]|nr:ATP-dependent DNA helicase [Deltaproteobacteria bacterium]